MSAPREWDRAIKEASEDAAADLTAAVDEELACLWYDLMEARRSALNGRWSIECDSIVTRIIVLTRFTKATHWERIQVELLVDGTYQGILESAGIAYEPPDMGIINDLHRQIQSGTIPIWHPEAATTGSVRQ